MPKVIPVYIGERMIYNAPSHWIAYNIYEKFWRVYNIRKIHRVHYPKDKWVVETGRKKEWVNL